MLKKLMKGMLALAMAAMMVSTAVIPSYAEELAELIIDDSDAAWTWSAGNANNGGWGSGTSQDPASSEHWSNTPGATATLAFNGDAMELYGIKAPNHLMISIAVDGGQEVEADCYAASRTGGNELLYSSEAAGIELAKGDHTAVVTVLSKANENAQNAQGVSLTYAKVFHCGQPDEPEPEFPGYTIIEDVKTTESNELFKIRYNGSWSGGGSYYPNLFHDGYEHYAHGGDSYEMRFIGSKAEIWASKNQAHGIYDVFVDGTKVGEADAATTSSSAIHQQLLYTTPKLEYGEHTLKVELPASSTKAIQLDYLKVYHEPIGISGIVLDKEAVTLIPGGSASLTAQIEPWIASGTIAWRSDNPVLVSVEEGLVQAAEEIEEKTTVKITAFAQENPDVFAEVMVSVDPSLAFMNAYVGDEKLLDTAESYESLQTGSNPCWNGTAWQGDTLSSKINVVSMSRTLTNVRAEISDFTSENGAVLDKESVSLSWLEDVTANIGRGNQSAPVKQFPDRMGKAESVDIPAHSARFAWLSLQVPENAAHGEYKGTVTITADGLKVPFVLDYTLTVIHLKVPAMENTELQIWQHPFSAANYYLGLGSNVVLGGVSNELNRDFYFTDAHFDLMRSSMKEYAAAGGHDAVANIVEEAWNHQSFYGDPSMVSWTLNQDGTWSFDYTWFDAWIEFLIDCGVVDPASNLGQIKCYSIVPWNNQIAYTDAASGSTVKKSYTPGSDAWKSIWTTFLQDFISHIEAKGWFDITYISMDERGLSDLQPAVELIESVVNAEGKHLKISSALNYSAPQYYDFTDRIDDISINQGNAANRQQMEALSAHRKEKGLKTTLYNCTGDYPSNFLISDPGDNYWAMWYSLSLGADGFMRWAWDNYVYDMYGNTSYRYWEPGDGWFIYPEARENVIEGTDAAIYSSPRWEMLKQGVRDTAKARWLLDNEAIDEESKADLRAALSAMVKPSSTTSYGSAVASSQAQRMSAHSQTQACKTASDALAVYAAGKLGENALQADKTLLEMAVNYALKVKEENGLDKVNGLVVSRFEAALASAQALLADASASQKAVNQAWMDLSYAIHLLGFKADKTALAALVEQAEALDLDQYADDEAKAAFEDALAHAGEILNSETALDASIKEAAAALAAAMEGLHPAASSLDTRLLAWLVNEVKDIDLNLYLAAGQDEFTDALAAGQAVLANPQSQQQIDEALDTLNNACLALRLAPDEEVLAALQAFVQKVSALDESLFAEAELIEFKALANEIDTAIAGNTLDKGRSESMKAKADGYSALIDQRMASAAAPAGSAGTSAPAVSASKASAGSSVKTAAGFHTAAYLAMGAAAAVLLAANRRKK